MKKNFILIVFIIFYTYPLFAENFPHIKTWGIDYDLGGVNSGKTSIQWLATHHDWIIGLQRHGFTTIDPEKMSENLYDSIKAANPGAKIVMYIPFATVFDGMRTWMEDWCKSNEYNPEDLYYHYVNNITIGSTQGDQFVKGFGGGSALSLTEARVPSMLWGGRYPSVCPTSPTFRSAFKNMVLELCTINKSKGKYADGILLDSFQAATFYRGGPMGTKDNGCRYLENTIEMKNLLGNSVRYDQALAQVKNDLILSKKEMEDYCRLKTGNALFIVLANAVDISDIYQWYKELFVNRFKDDWTEIAVEFLIKSGINSWIRIPNLKQIYDDLVAGHTFFINSETTYGTDVPFNFIQFILSTHYLINHPNAIFSYHRGSASYYGGESGDMSKTHWHKNMEYNIGTPFKRSGKDFWGVTNTDRFFLFAEGTDYKILGREYSNALVLAKFGNIGGWVNIGINPTTHNLGEPYRRLLEDNSLGPPITEITLGFGEGMILIKDRGNLPPSPPRGLKLY